MQNALPNETRIYLRRSTLRCRCFATITAPIAITPNIATSGSHANDVPCFGVVAASLKLTVLCGGLLACAFG